MSEGFASEFVELDVASPKSCAAAAATIHTNDGRLDILVNNAGIGHVGTILETTSEDLERLFAVNVRGMFDLTKAFIDRMIERKYGVVINVASIGGVIAIRERLAYCTTKFAVVGFTKCLALDHALQGIRANCVCPGRVETEFVQKRIAEYPDPEKAYREMAASQAIFGRGDLRALDEATVAAVAAAVPRAEVDGELPSLTDLLVASGLVSSRSEARRTVTEGGAYLNNERVADPERRPTSGDLLHGHWLVLRKGKRSVAMIERRS